MLKESSLGAARFHIRSFEHSSQHDFGLYVWTTMLLEAFGSWSCGRRCPQELRRPLRAVRGTSGRKSPRKRGGDDFSGDSNSPK